MPEVSSTEAARIIGISSQSIRRHVKSELLPARQQGVRGLMRIDLDDLREFAAKYEYRFNEELAESLAK